MKNELYDLKDSVNIDIEYVRETEQCLNCGLLVAKEDLHAFYKKTCRDCVTEANYGTVSQQLQKKRKIMDQEYEAYLLGILDADYGEGVTGDEIMAYHQTQAPYPNV